MENEPAVARNEEHLVKPRRTFLGSLGAALATIALAPRFAKGIRPSSKMLPLQAHDAAVLKALELDTFVNPPPLVGGYVLASARTYGRLGFKKVNDRQAVFRFHALKLHSHRRALRVIVAHEPAGDFWRTGNREPQEIVFKGASGREWIGQYYNGFWEVSHLRTQPNVDPDGWNSTDLHTLIVRAGPVAIAVGGYRSMAIETQDLFEIARAML